MGGYLYTLMENKMMHSSLLPTKKQSLALYIQHNPQMQQEQFFKSDPSFHSSVPGTPSHEKSRGMEQEDRERTAPQGTGVLIPHLQGPRCSEHTHLSL